MFLDEVHVFVKAGDGGRGCVAFRREKFVPRGGPSGGDGGNGGSVVVCASGHWATLAHLYNRHHVRAGRGEHGRGSNQTGASGHDAVIEVAPGTVIHDVDTGEQLADLVADGSSAVVAAGGKGGRGNQHFATPTHQAPRHAEPGLPGDERHIRLELRLLADVGLVGLPNAGKSTLLSRVSAARPKVADYPFTTLVPHLGVVSRNAGERSLVFADLPGLIEGAHSGAGLGHRFLRHVERCRLLLHLVDLASEVGVAAQVEMLRHELELYDPDLVRREVLLVGTKVDALSDPERVTELEDYALSHDLAYVMISAVSGQGVDELLEKTFALAGPR
jgi:GTPase